jgi:hypothetical protein
VEGPSDKAVLETILSDLIERKYNDQVFIEIQDAGGGDRKVQLLENIPVRAADKIGSDSRIEVIVLPDLYPKNKGFPHENYDELKTGIFNKFRSRLSKKGITDSQLLENRFHVFCFKHDLEVLLLASSDALLNFVGLSKTSERWEIPVEDQNFDQPPKLIVRKIFQEAGLRYNETTDAVEILATVELGSLLESCPECFMPFVQYLEST